MTPGLASAGTLLGSPGPAQGFLLLEAALPGAYFLFTVTGNCFEDKTLLRNLFTPSSDRRSSAQLEGRSNPPGPPNFAVGRSNEEVPHTRLVPRHLPPGWRGGGGGGWRSLVRDEEEQTTERRLWSRMEVQAALVLVLVLVLASVKRSGQSGPL